MQEKLTRLSAVEALFNSSARRSVALAHQIGNTANIHWDAWQSSATYNSTASVKQLT